MKLVVTGAAGRMGRMLIKAVLESEHCTLLGALEREGSDFLGQDAGILAGLPPVGVSVTHDALELFVKADGILDFTSPASTLEFAHFAAQARIVHVIGTTGFSPEHIQKLKIASHHCAIVQSGNMSLGVNVLAELVQQAARALDYDIEIVEMHHRMKVDAPSGTALLLGDAAAAGRDIALQEHSVRVRDGHTGIRPEGTIGFASLRGGTVVGDHSVILAGNGERIELSHKAEDRSIFAQGAIKAALWGFGKKPGFYSMKHVLGL